MNANPRGEQRPDGPRVGALRWVGIENATRQGLMLLQMLMLTRLLGPESMGLVATAVAIIALFGVLADLGLTDAALRDTGDEERSLLDATFWLQSAAGCALALLCAAVALPLAAAFGQPQLGGVLAALAPVVALNAAAGAFQVAMQRAARWRALAGRTLLSLSLGGVVGVWLAWSGAGVWSLVGQSLTTAATNLASLTVASRWRPRPIFDSRIAAPLLAFGRQRLGTLLLNFVSRKSDDLLIGFFLGPAALGFYSLAYQVLVAFELLLLRGFDAFALVRFAQVRGDRGELSRSYRAAVTAAAAFVVPAFAGLALVAPVAVPVLFGPAWLPAALPLQILCAVGVLHCLSHYNHVVFSACGQPSVSLRLGAWNAVANVAAFALAVPFGYVAVAGAYALRAWVLAPFTWIAVGRLIDLRSSLPLRTVLGVLCSTAVMAVAAAAVLMLAPLGAALRLALACTLGAAVYLLALRLVAPAAFAAWRACLPRLRAGARVARAISPA